MSGIDTVDLFNRFVVPNYGRFNLQLERGEGCRVWDENGKRYLDFGAGIAVCSIGHCHPRLVKVMTEQLQRLVHVSNLYYSRPQGLLAERLVGYVGQPGKIFFCNSGAEANEALYKLSRKFGNETVPPPPIHSVGELVEMESNRYEVITFNGSFHGRTLAGISATAQEKVKKGFEPMVDGFLHVPFNDAPALLGAITPKTAAVLIEPIQGEGGIKPASASFLKTVRSICDDYRLLLLFDEIQCGLGRTGDWCGWRSIAPDVQPDAISWAKGIAGGFPLGAIWVADKQIPLKNGSDGSLADLLGPGSHGTTFGGTPLVCAGANEVLDIIEQEGLLENARKLGAYAKTKLEQLRTELTGVNGAGKAAGAMIKEIRIIGLMIGIELSGDFEKNVASGGRPPGLFVIDRLHEAGLLTVPAGTHTLRWLPPLNVTIEEMDEAVEILRSVLLSLPAKL